MTPTPHELGRIVPVSQLEPGQNGVIKSVRGNRRVRQRLADLGLVPETSICVLKTVPFNGPIEVSVKGSKLAIGREIADDIIVQARRT